MKITRTMGVLFLGGGMLALGCGGSAKPAVAPAEPASDAALQLARFKAKTGGSSWDGVTSVQTTGTLSAGGLSGPITTVVDAMTGRSVAHYTLGPVTAASGFDGTTGWEQDPGGEVSALDAAEAREAARTDAWLAALAYWYPSRMPGALGALTTQEEAGHTYHLVLATPAGGKPVTLWFDEADLLVRTVERRGGDTFTTRLDDYRDVSGVRIPFHVVVDDTDAAGRTDPRSRTEQQIASATTNGGFEEAAFAMPKMARTARIDGDGASTQISFELLNNHIYAAGSIDGKPVRFLVDTGGVNVVTPAAAAKLGLKSEGKLAAGGVGDDKVDLALAHAGEVRLGNAVLEHPVFYVIDLGSLPAGEGTDLDGVVGFEMFRRFRATIDYAARVLTLTDPAKFVAPAGAHVVPFDMAERIPIVSGTLDGLPVRISVDTGSRASLTLHSPFVRDHGLVARYGAAAETVTGWGVGGASRGRPARLGALTLGDVTVHDIAGDLYTGDKGSFANPDLSANLGGGVLHRFTVTFDYEARKMYLVPNASFDQPDLFDRSGLWLFADGDALKVVALAPDGPAAKAGVAVDDRILRLNDEPSSSRSLADWRQRLRELPVGTHVSLALTRAGAPQTIDIVLADMIPAHAR